MSSKTRPRSKRSLSLCPTAPRTPATAAELARCSASRLWRLEFDSIERRIATNRQQIEQLQRVTADYQARVEASPTLETQLTQLTRDYDTLQATYTSLLMKVRTPNCRRMEERSASSSE